MTVIFGDRDTEWGPGSLGRLTARLRAPLPRYCVNPKCGKVRKRRADKHGRAGYEGALDLCAACYNRFVDHGRPDTGVPDPLTNDEVLAMARATQARKRAGEVCCVTKISAANEAITAKLAARLEDYAFLRAMGCSMADAGARVGVKGKTIERYEARRLAGQIPAGEEATEEWWAA